MKKKTMYIYASSLIAGLFVTSAIVSCAVIYNSKNKKVDPILNSEAKKIIADYDNKSDIEPSQIEPSKIKFSGLNFNNIEVVVKSYKVSMLNPTILCIVFAIKNTISNNESDDKIIEIKGFKKPAKLYTKEELNKIIEKVTSATYNGEVEETFIKDVTKEKIIFSPIENEFEVLVKSLSVNIKNLRTLLITFTVRVKGAKVESESNTLEIQGFKKPIT